MFFTGIPTPTLDFIADIIGLRPDEKVSWIHASRVIAFVASN
jgi:hypothetical protein